MSRIVDGFTLIELLVAIAVFAVVISISSTLTASLSINNTSRNVLLANQAAQSFIETLSDSWKNPDNFGKLDTTFVAPSNSITGYTSSVTFCEADSNDVTKCLNSFTPLSDKSNLPKNFTSNLIRVTVVYTSTLGKSPLSITTELNKR